MDCNNWSYSLSDFWLSRIISPIGLVLWHYWIGLVCLLAISSHITFYWSIVSIKFHHHSNYVDFLQVQILHSEQSLFGVEGGWITSKYWNPYGEEYTGECNPFMTSLDSTYNPLSYSDGVLRLFGWLSKESRFLVGKIIIIEHDFLHFIIFIEEL